MSIWSSRATMQTARRREEQGPRCSSGDATPQVRKHAFKCGAVARSRVAPTRIYAQALLRRPRALAATRVGRGGEQRPMPLLSALGQVDEAQAASACSGAHLFVGSPRNIDILLRALLLDLHPTLPPSHTCLHMKQVLATELTDKIKAERTWVVNFLRRSSPL